MENLFLKAFNAAQKGQSYAFATIIESTLKGTPRKVGAKMVVMSDGSIFGSIGGGRNEYRAQIECLKAIKSKKTKITTYIFDEKPGNSICGGQIKVFIEPFFGKRHGIICGAGHIALALSVILKILNYKVSIIDNRSDFANHERFPHVDNIFLGNHEYFLNKIDINRNSFIFIVTHGYEHDYNCLEIAIKSSANYIGFISSKVKKIKFIKKLRERGFSEKKIGRIHAPMGLNIGSQTPEEIAISIVSELIAKNHHCLETNLKYNYKY